MKGLLRPHAGHLFMEQAPERELLLSLSSFLPAAYTIPALLGPYVREEQ